MTIHTPPSASGPLPVSFDDIKAAHAAISPFILRTACVRSPLLSQMFDADVWLKFENRQFTGAFKERGALNKLLSLPEEVRSRGVIAASAGNHSQGLAYHAKRLGVPATIVMPRPTPMVKVEKTECHGAQVILAGDSFDESKAHAHMLEKERGLTFVHPFDDPAIIAGQGTVALEMLEDAPDLDCLIVPIGGGGLMAGMAIAARAMKPQIEMVGVQAELFPSMACKLKGEDSVCGRDSLAEGISVKQPGDLTFQIVRELVHDVLLVSEDDLEQAVVLLLQAEKTLVEGAGAAGVATLLAHKDRFKGRKLGLILCGGNMDSRLLANVLLRDLVRQGRLARLRLRLHDQPGQLFEVSRIFDEQRVNIIEVYHQRIFTTLPAKGLITDIECETRDRAHLDSLVKALNQAGYRVSRVDLD